MQKHIEKKIIEQIERLYWDEESISEIRKELDRLEKKGVTNIHFKHEDEWITITAYKERKETKEEAKTRRLKEIKIKKQRLKWLTTNIETLKKELE